MGSSVLSVSRRRQKTQPQAPPRKGTAWKPQHRYLSALPSQGRGLASLCYPVPAAPPRLVLLGVDTAQVEGYLPCPSSGDRSTLPVAQVSLEWLKSALKRTFYSRLLNVGAARGLCTELDSLYNNQNATL